MHFNAWLEADQGRPLAVANHFGITPSAVSQWKSNGVPPKLMKAVRDFTRGDVTLEEMLPDPPRGGIKALRRRKLARAAERRAA